MRRLLRPLIAAATTLGAAVAASGLLAGPAPAAPAPASLGAISCHSPVSPAMRAVSVTSTMRHLPHTRRLQVRFTLKETVAGAAPVAVRDGDLGRWLSPTDPSLGRRPADVWKLTKAVYDVTAPARYRFVVSFRWLGAHGAVLTTRRLVTALCHEREMRPDVLVRGVAVHPVAGHPRRDRYIATIANRGRSASGPFAVSFTAGADSAMQTRPVASLGPGARIWVAFTAGICDAADPPTVVADPDDRVDDYDRSNNTTTVVCPAAAEVDSEER